MSLAETNMLIKKDIKKESLPTAKRLERLFFVTKSKKIVELWEKPEETGYFFFESEELKQENIPTILNINHLFSSPKQVKKHLESVPLQPDEYKIFGCMLDDTCMVTALIELEGLDEKGLSWFAGFTTRSPDQKPVIELSPEETEQLKDMTVATTDSTASVQTDPDAILQVPHQEKQSEKQKELGQEQQEEPKEPKEPESQTNEEKFIVITNNETKTSVVKRLRFDEKTGKLID